MKKPKVVVVDEKDNFVGYKERSDRSIEDIIRISGVWLINDKKEVLIAQRSLDKKHDPGKWGPSVAGTVEEGEGYFDNAVKETQEELGYQIDSKKLILGPKRFTKTSHQYFAQIYFYRTNAPTHEFEIQKEEVEQVMWIDIQELREWFKKTPADFIASFGPTLGDLDSISL